MTSPTAVWLTCVLAAQGKRVPLDGWKKRRAPAGLEALGKFSNFKLLKKPMTGEGDLKKAAHESQMGCRKGFA